MLPFTSLNGVGSAGPGAAHDLEGAARDITLIGWTTGNPTGCTVVLEGSHDQANWIALGTTPITSGIPLAVTVNTNWVRYVRANLTALSGGSAPTVTATVLADVADEE